MIEMKAEKKEKIDLVKICENTTIVYKNGNREIFDAVQITENGVTTGYISKDRKFEEGGFIPKNNIKKIIHGSKYKEYEKKQIDTMFFLLFIKLIFFNFSNNNSCFFDFFTNEKFIKKRR